MTLTIPSLKSLTVRKGQGQLYDIIILAFVEDGKEMDFPAYLYDNFELSRRINAYSYRLMQKEWSVPDSVIRRY